MPKYTILGYILFAIAILCAVYGEAVQSIVFYVSAFVCFLYETIMMFRRKRMGGGR